MDIKKVIIAIIVILILAVCVFFGVNAITSGNKSYIIEEIKESDYKYFAVYTDGKYGVIDEKGDMIVEANYDDVIIPNPTKAVFVCKNNNGGTEILNNNKEKIFTTYKNVQAIPTNGTTTYVPYEKSVLKYEEDGKYGLINFEGKTVTKPIYEELSSVKYKEGEILAKKDGKYGVINSKGVKLIPFEYEEIEADKFYDNGYEKSGYIVKNRKTDGYRYGYIDCKWKKLLNTEYTAITRILDVEDNDVYLIAAKNGQYGIIKNKDVQVDFAYQSIMFNKDTNLLSVQRTEKYGVVSLSGETIVPVEYKSIRFNGTYICARGYEEDIYFDCKGKKMENGYTGMKEIGGLNCSITTNTDNLYGIIDSSGKTLVENSYLYIDYAFDKYFVAYKVGEGLGVIDKNNNVIVNFEYDVLSRIGDKQLLKAVDMDNSKDITTIFSKTMENLVTLEHSSISIYDDYVEIYNKEKEIFIDNEGIVKTSKEMFPNNKLFGISQNGKWGFENKSGTVVVPYTYDDITEFNRFGYAGVKSGNKWGVIDETGKLILECKFEFDEEGTKPEFLGKYYRAYKENNEAYYTDENFFYTGEGL